MAQTIPKLLSQRGCFHYGPPVGVMLKKILTR